jgi:hypothetical protein
MDDPEPCCNPCGKPMPFLLAAYSGLFGLAISTGSGPTSILVP